MYDEALSLEPQNTYALLQLARARIMVDPPQLDEALSNVNSIIGLENLNGNAWKLKGDIHTMMKDYEAAEKALIQAVGMSQGDARFEAQQSLAYVRRSKPGSSTTIPTQFRLSKRSSRGSSCCKEILTSKTMLVYKEYWDNHREYNNLKFSLLNVHSVIAGITTARTMVEDICMSYNRARHDA